ncbi:hypothetical protein [Halomicrococcus sp. SG-WS-1]|uniref:hypothetical protein n=1 Tax=Halomicrococcus sp. SG-WS-1 TaxID=3439057 RepID=UPI003F7B052F
MSTDAINGEANPNVDTDIDVSTANTMRERAGESHPRTDPDSGEKAVDDDSGGDGASLIGPQNSRGDADTQQATFGTDGW